MTVLGVLGRFALVYIALIIIAGAILNYLGVSSSGGVNIGILIGTLCWVCTAFAKKNGRYFDKSEKIKVIAGFIIINILIQGAFSAAALVGSKQEVSLSMMLFVLGFVGLLHAAAIYFFVGVVHKSLIKNGVIDS